VSDGDSAGGYDIAVFKISNNGNILWVKQFEQFNTSALDTKPVIACDIDGNCYVAFQTLGIASGGALSGGEDIVIFKLDVGGNHIWTVQQNIWNTSLDDSEPSITCDTENIYIAYTTEGIVSGGQTTGSRDISILKLDFSGYISWVKQSTEWNTGSDDDKPSIAVSSGYIYVAYRTSGIVSSGTYSGGYSDIAVLQMDTSGNIQWLEQLDAFNTAGDDFSPCITCDSYGNSYVTYYTTGVVSGGVKMNPSLASNDIVVFKLDASGSFLWTRQLDTFNTTGNDRNPRIACNDTSVFVVYYTDGISSGGVHSGQDDIVIFRLDTSGDTQWIKQVNTFNTEFNDQHPDIACAPDGECYITYHTAGVVSGGDNIGHVDIVALKITETLQIDIIFVDTPQTSTESTIYVNDAQYPLAGDYIYHVYNQTATQDERIVMLNGQQAYVELREGNLVADGQGYDIDLTGVTNFYGICAVRGASNATIRNIFISIDSSSNLARYGGYVCSGETVGGTIILQNNRVISSSDINIDMVPDIAGGNACIIGGHNISGNFNIRECYVSCYTDLNMCQSSYGCNGLIMGGENQSGCVDITITQCSCLIGNNANINNEGDGFNSLFLGGFNNLSGCTITVDNCTAQVSANINLLEPTQGAGCDGFIIGGYNTSIGSIDIQYCLVCCKNITMNSNNTAGCRVILGDNPGTSQITIMDSALLCTEEVTADLPLLATTGNISGCKVYYGTLIGTGTDTTGTVYSTVSDVSAYSFVDANARKWQILADGLSGINSLNKYVLYDYDGSSTETLTVNITSVSGQNVYIPVSSPFNIYLPLLPNIPYYSSVIVNTGNELRATMNSSGLPVFILNNNEISVNDDIALDGKYYQLLAVGSALLKAFVPIPCFTGDARVLTSCGEVPISMLRPGTLIVTGDKCVAPCTKVHKRIVAADNSTCPYVIPPGLYGCHRELLISPNHCVRTADGMLPARKLKLRRRYHRGRIEYLNVQLLDSRDTMIVNGVIVESLR
jgi:hypothetical protein